MTGRRNAVLVAVVVVAMSASCDIGRPIDDAGQPIAWVGGEKLTPADLRFSAPLDELDQRQETIDRGIDELLIAREARRRGLGYTELAAKKIVAVRKIAEIRERMILRDALYEVVTSEIEVTEAELREEFDRSKGTVRRRYVTLRWQTFPSPVLAAQVSPSDTESNVVGPLLARELSPVLRQAAKRLASVGDRVVVPSGEEWTGVELIAERAAAPPDFERGRAQLEERIRSRRADEAFDREIERLRADADIRLEAGALENGAFWSKLPTSDDSLDNSPLSSGAPDLQPD